LLSHHSLTLSHIAHTITIIKRIEYRRLESPDELEDVYRLRYQAFRREGFIEESAEQRCVDPLDFVDNQYVFGLYLDGKLISSIRLHVLDKNHRQSPSMLVYSDKLDPMLDSGKVLIDPSRFCVDYESSKKYRALPYATLRLPSMASIHFEADQCLTMVRKDHAAFYRKVYQSRQIGESRNYPKVSFQVGLYSTEISKIRTEVLGRYPFFKASIQEKESLFDKESLETL